MTHIKTLLSAYMDGELDERERHRAEAHLKECPACRKELETLEGIDKLLSRVKEVDPSPQFEAAVLRSFRRSDGLPGHPRAPRAPAEGGAGVWADRVGRAPGFFEQVWQSLLSPVPVMAGVAAVIMVLGLFMAHELTTEGLDEREEYEISESLGILQEYPLLQELDLYENLEAFQGGPTQQSWVPAKVGREG